MKPGTIVGIDFDNTMICYDQVFLKNALDSNLVTAGHVTSKKELRDQVRLLPQGDILWQKMQAFAYSRGIFQASIYAGVQEFLEMCKAQGIQAYIVSHKTEYAPFDEQKINLRQAALQWMSDQQFFNADGPALKKEHVYFEATRLDKIRRVQSLGCTHFIDDLEEVFLEAAFPQRVEKILFAPQTDHAGPVGIKVFKSWNKIHEYFFN